MPNFFIGLLLRRKVVVCLKLILHTFLRIKGEVGCGHTWSGRPNAGLEEKLCDGQDGGYLKVLLIFNAMKLLIEINGVCFLSRTKLRGQKQTSLARENIITSFAIVCGQSMTVLLEGLRGGRQGSRKPMRRVREGNYCIFWYICIVWAFSCTITTFVRFCEGSLSKHRENQNLNR